MNHSSGKKHRLLYTLMTTTEAEKILNQAQKSGSVKLVNGIPNLPSFYELD